MSEEFIRIESLTREDANYELNEKLARSHPRDKLELLTQILTLVETSGEVNTRVIFDKLKTFVKSKLIMESLKSQVAQFGEPVLSVEKLLQLVEADRKYLQPIDYADVDLIKSFVKGSILKACPRKNVKFEKCIEVLLHKLVEGLGRIETDDITVEVSNFDEITLPSRLKVYFNSVDLMMKYLLITLFELCKHGCFKDLLGPARLPSTAEVNCEETSLVWIRNEVQNTLQLIAADCHNMLVEHTTGTVLAEPTIFFRENIIENTKRTICFLGFVSDFADSTTNLQFDQVYTSKKFYSSNVQDMKGPLIAFITAIKLIKSVNKTFPFNLKMILFPFRIKDEFRMKTMLESRLDFFKDVDFLVLMNGIDYLSPEPVLISSSVGEKTYSLAIYIPSDHPEFGQEAWARMKTILFEVMDLIRSYKFLVKHKKTLKAVEVSVEEFWTNVELGCVKESFEDLEEGSEKTVAAGWRTTVSLKYYGYNRHLTAMITAQDFHLIREGIQSRDPILADCYFQFSLTDSCQQWTARDEYYDTMAPILKLAFLRGSDKNHFYEAKANSALPLPVLLQKLLKKETVAVSFAGSQEFGHDAWSFNQAREAVKIAVCIIMGLIFDIAPLSETETKYRQIDVLDVTGIADIKIKSHLESPFCKNDPYIEQIYADFLEELKPKTKPSVSVPSLAPPEETDFHEAGLVAKYFSLEENLWVLVKYSYIEKVELQRNYVQLARSICQSRGVWKHRLMAQRMVSFLLYLFFKKRRSDVICRNCKVYESRFVRTSFLSALAKSSSIDVTDENTECLISNFANPKWSPLKDGDTKACKLVDKNGLISFKVFMRLVKDLIYNIAFDGDEQSPVEHLFRIILAERRNYQNHNMIKAIASNTFNAGRGMKLPIDTNRHLHPSYLKIVPRKLFNFQKLYKCNFINDLICSEELQNYIILHSILKFVTEKDSPSIPKPQVGSASLRSLLYRRTELREDSMYRLVDRTKLEKLLNNEVIVLPPVRLDLLLSQEVKAFYKCSTDWFKIFSYLIKKSEKAILLYNEFWDFYKTKLHNIETGTPIDKVFPNNFESRGIFFNQELAINLKTYIKYSITILEHFLRLKSYLIELYLLYSVKPKFLQYEAFYIIRHALPKFDAHTSTDGYFKVINFLEDLKRYKWKLRRHQRQIRTIMKQVTGSMAESSSRIEIGEEKLKTNLNIFNSPSSVGILGGMLSQAPHFESILSISDPSAYQPSDPFNPKTILKKTKLELKLKRMEREVLTLLLAAREKWQDGSSNNLRDFEDVFLLNSQFWINYSEMTDVTVYKFCESIYEEIITVLKNSLTEGRGKTFDEQCPRNLKDYALKKMMKSIKSCIKHYAHRIKAIYCNLRMLNSDYTKRPLDYYERLYGCYVAIYNLLNAIMGLQDNFPTVLPPESIRELKIKFPSLHIVNL